MKKKYSPIQQLHENWSSYGRQTARGIAMQQHGKAKTVFPKLEDAHPSVPDMLMRIKPTNQRAAHQGYERQIRDLKAHQDMFRAKLAMRHFQSDAELAGGVMREITPAAAAVAKPMMAMTPKRMVLASGARAAHQEFQGGSLMRLGPKRLRMLRDVAKYLARKPEL